MSSPRSADRPPGSDAPRAAGVGGGPAETPNAPVNTRPVVSSNPKEKRAKEADEDRELVAKARDGDMGAFRALVERYQTRALAIAIGLVRDENDARELVQESFVRVFRSLDGFQGDSSFFTWLHRIMTNLGIDWLRKPGRRTIALDEQRLAAAEADESYAPFLSHFEDADPALAVSRHEIAARLRAALDELPSYHRTVIVLRELEGLSYEEIAEAVGVNKGTVMSRLFHARQKLQRALADCYEEQIGAHPGDRPGGRAADGVEP